jgi:hypothetical protein
MENHVAPGCESLFLPHARPLMDVTIITRSGSRDALEVAGRPFASA